MIHSFLLVGQSNMAGRGIISEVEPLDQRRIRLLRNGLWRPAFVPYHWDTDTAGIGLAESFADAYKKDNPDVQVGIIAQADGGTCLNQWMPGQPLYESAVSQAKFAMRESEIKAILWHQGEGDTSAERYPLYEEKCTHILTSMRDALGLDVPVIVGGLGDFLPQCPDDPQLANYVHVNAALKAMVEKNKRFGFVSAEGLTPNADNLHFNAASLRTFGLRYYEVYKNLK